MSLCVIQSLWIGGDLSPLEQLCLASFIAHGHEFHLYTYDVVRNVPRGVVLKDAGPILPPDQVFKEREFGSYAAFSNLFRYKLLLERGGVWCDADMACVKPWRFDAELVFCEQRTPEGGREANGNVMRTPPGSPVMEFCYTEGIRKMNEGYTWGELGPAVVTAAIQRFELRHAVLPYKVFNPIDYWKADCLFSSSLRVRLRLEATLAWGVYGIHLWHSIWTRRGADPSATYPRFCLYESLKRRYLPAGSRRHTS
jgi:hypothetical protein